MTITAGEVVPNAVSVKADTASTSSSTTRMGPHNISTPNASGANVFKGDIVRPEGHLRGPGADRRHVRLRLRSPSRHEGDDHGPVIEPGNLEAPGIGRGRHVRVRRRAARTGRASRRARRRRCGHRARRREPARPGRPGPCRADGSSGSLRCPPAVGSLRGGIRRPAIAGAELAAIEDDVRVADLVRPRSRRAGDGCRDVRSQGVRRRDGDAVDGR